MGKFGVHAQLQEDERPVPGRLDDYCGLLTPAEYRRNRDMTTKAQLAKCVLSYTPSNVTANVTQCAQPEQLPHLRTHLYGSNFT